MAFRGRLDLLIRRLRRAAGSPTDAASDASLLERFVAGRDEAAFELLLWRHGPMVLGVCRRMLRSAEDAEDAFQAAFLLLARKAASIRRREAVAGWLYQTACRVALRARMAARKLPVAAHACAEPTASAEPDLVWRDLRPVLDEEVRRLPKKYRLPIILCYFQGRTHAEAALELGCPRGTVGVRLARARELLRGRLTRRGLALSAAALAVLAAERTASAAAPAALVHATLKAALLFAAGKAVAAAASARAVAWTQGVLRTMFLTKLKVLAAVLVLVGAVGGGTSYLMAVRAAPPRPDALLAPQVLAAPAPGVTLTEVPTEREGRIALVGTDVKAREAVAAKDRVRVGVGFLAVELGDKSDPNLTDKAPEPWWASVDPTGKKTYARWKTGDPLPAGKLVVAREEREYRKLRVGDRIEEGQLLAIVEEGPALDELAIRIRRQDAAEADYRAAVKTKEEAIRRASSAELLWSKGKGFISEDDYRAALLSRDRFIEEEIAKDAARNIAREELVAAIHLLKACEIRSEDNGVVKEILKRRGEGVHALEPVVRLEVQDSAAETPDKPSTPPAPAAVNVPAQRDGVLLAVGREIKEGEKVVPDRVVTVKVDGEEKRYLRLAVGDVVEEGQLLARMDDRLARLDVEVQKDKLDAAEAALAAAAKTMQAAAQYDQAVGKLRANAAASEADVRAARLDLDRAEGDQRVKQAAVRQAKTELEEAQTVLEMYEVRSPVRGVVKAVLKGRGEAVKNLETVVQIEEKKE